MRTGYKRLGAGILATAALAIGLSFSKIKSPEYFSFANQNGSESTENPRKHQDELPAREPIQSFPVERQSRFYSKELTETYRSSLSLDTISTPSGSRQNPITGALKTYLAYVTGEKLRTLNHEVNGHGRVLKEFQTPYDVAINVGPLTITGDKDFEPSKGSSAATRSRKVTGKLDNAITIGGVWGSKNLYGDLHDHIVREGLDGTTFNGKLAHWTAFWAGIDLMDYYRIDKQSAQESRARNGDMRVLMDRGYGTDLKRAVVADLLGDGPELLWHAAQGLGIEMKRPRLWEFKIPGTDSTAVIKPTAYIDPFNKVIAPAVEVQIRF